MNNNTKRMWNRTNPAKHHTSSSSMVNSSISSSFRKTKYATNQQTSAHFKSLQDRLDTIKLLELKEDGGKEYHDMTLRNLYNYVLKTITNKPREGNTMYASTMDINSSSGRSFMMASKKNIVSSGSNFPPLPSSLSPNLQSQQQQQQQQHRPLSTILESSSSTSSATTPTTEQQQPQPKEPKEMMLPPSSIPLSPNLEKGFSSRTTATATYPQQPAVVTYRERLGAYLHPRDMRRLVTPFSSSNEPALIVRRHVILLNFDPLRAIVLRDRVLVIVPDGADSVILLLESRVRVGGSASTSFDYFHWVECEGNTSMHSSILNDTSGHDAVVVKGLDMIEEEGYDEKGNTATGIQSNTSQKDLMNNEKTEDNECTKDDENEDNISYEDDDGDSAEYDEDDINRDSEWEDIEAMKWIKMAFELQAVDAVLVSVIKMLSTDIENLNSRVIKVMDDLRESYGDNHQQDTLRLLKDEVKEMESRIQGFVRAINQILDEDEDMALMNLSRLITNPERFIQPVTREVLEEESDEPELVLEAYLQQALSEVNKLELLKGKIVNTEEAVSSQLDMVRNRLLYVNTMVSLVTLSVSFASLVGSFFGMNLKNRLEDTDNVFGVVIICTVFGSALLLLVTIYTISKFGALPYNPLKIGKPSGAKLNI